MPYSVIDNTSGSEVMRTVFTATVGSLAFGIAALVAALVSEDANY